MTSISTTSAPATIGARARTIGAIGAVTERGVRAAGDRLVREPVALAALGAGALVGAGLVAIARHLRRSNLLDVRDLHMRVCELALGDDDELMEVFPPIQGVAPTRQDLYCNVVLYLQRIAWQTGAIGRAELRAVLRYWMTSEPMREFWEQVRGPRQTIIGADRREQRFHRFVDEAHAATEPAPRDPDRPDPDRPDPDRPDPDRPETDRPETDRRVPAGPVHSGPTPPDQRDT